MEKSFYILYTKENETTALFTDNVEDVQKFLGHKTKAVTLSRISRCINGHRNYVKDTAGHLYTVARFKESELK